MVFNSFAFVAFFAIVFLIYFIVGSKSGKLQNYILLLASYVFYGYASWKLLPILIITTVVFYFLGLKIKSSSEETASRLKVLGIIIGVGLLLYFKYLNFFIESFASLFELFGLHTNWHSFNIIIPLGISFFTFKLISYVIEVEHEEIEPSKDFIEFANYVAFFPCILSGPIDRPNTFIPQLRKVHKIDYCLATNGCTQIIWGLFKKMVVADNCAVVCDSIWRNFDVQNSSTLILTAALYVFQVYADFSGYSDMAIGVSKLLGFRVTCNFKYPLFASSIPEYWRRWHVSLTTWLTDYVFMPLNFTFRRMKNVGIIFAIIINFILVGFWHGANWTYGLLGLYYGCLFIPWILSGKFQESESIKINVLGLPSFIDLIKITCTMILVTIGFIMFRANSIPECFNYIGCIFTNQLLTLPSFAGDVNTIALLSIFFIAIMMILEWIWREHEFVLDSSKNNAIRYILIIFFTLSIYYFGETTTSFVYFQF